MTVPRTIMLGYLPVTMTTSRVRKMACWGVLLAAAFYLLFAWLFAYAGMSWEFEYEISHGVLPAANEISEYFASPTTIIAFILLAIAIFMLVHSVLIYRRPQPSTIAVRVLLYLLALAFCTISAFALSAMALELPVATSSRLLIIGVFLLCTLFALLTLDIASYLKWLGRNPHEEMPKRPFV